MEPLAPVGSRVEGNTNTSTPDKSRKNAAKKWCFTVFSEIEMGTPVVDPLAPAFHGCKWLAGLETCPESGRLHYQGYVEFPIKVRPIGYKGFPKHWHWEKCRGTREENIAYCSKEDTNPLGNLRPTEVVWSPEPYGWQARFLPELLVWPADRRKIHWKWSEQGSIGKSDFARYLVVNHDALLCAGKASDMKFMIMKYKEEHGNGPRIVIFDVPRSNMSFLSYQGIEEIKNGVFASTKYESQMVVINPPHVLVLSNDEPWPDKMSPDRYDTEQLGGIILGSEWIAP